MTYRPLRGAEIQPYINQLGELRIAVFREFPYLYDGDLDYERSYLRVYAESPQSLVVLLEVDDRPVGATTCLPMTDEEAEFQTPFRDAGFDLGEVFYFGESIILPEFRGQGAGATFFDLRERHAAELGYRYTTFCAVDRPQNHPARPSGYRPLDAFWTRRGYERREDLRFNLTWKEVGAAEESSQSLTYWLRQG